MNFVLQNAFGLNTWFRYANSYVGLCTTVPTGTCGFTLGVHVCLRIAKKEITNYLSWIYYCIIHYFYIIYYNTPLFIIIWYLYIYIYIYIYIFQLFSKNSTLSNGYGSDHDALSKIYIKYLDTSKIPHISSLIAARYCGTQQHNILKHFTNQRIFIFPYKMLPTLCETRQHIMIEYDI